MIKLSCRNANGTTDNIEAIARIAKKAKRLNLSYGQYIALYGDTEPEPPPKTQPEPIKALNFKRNCIICGAEFYAGHPNAKACSEECRRIRAYNKKIEKGGK